MQTHWLLVPATLTAADFKWTVLPGVTWPLANKVQTGLCSTDQTVEGCASSCDNTTTCIGFVMEFISGTPCCSLMKDMDIAAVQAGGTATAYFCEFKSACLCDMDAPLLHIIHHSWKVPLHVLMYRCLC